MSENKFLVIILISLILFVSCATQVFSYCDPTNLADEPIAIEAEYDQSNQVFIGETGRIEPLNDFDKVKVSSDRLKVIFIIKKQYKGQKAQEIVLYEFVDGYKPTGYYSEDMSIVFEIGKKYLVYAKGGYEGVPLQTGLRCSRTRLLSDAEKDLEILGKITSDSNWKFDEQSYKKWKKTQFFN